MNSTITKRSTSSVDLFVWIFLQVRLEEHRATARVGKHHTEDDDYCNHSPDPFNSVLGTFVE